MCISLSIYLVLSDMEYFKRLKKEKKREKKAGGHLESWRHVRRRSRALNVVSRIVLKVLMSHTV